MLWTWLGIWYRAIVTKVLLNGVMAVRQPPGNRGARIDRSGSTAAGRSADAVRALRFGSYPCDDTTGYATRHKRHGSSIPRGIKHNAPLPRSKPRGHSSKGCGTMCAVVNCDEFENDDLMETLANFKTNLLVCTGIPWMRHTSTPGLGAARYPTAARCPKRSHRILPRVYALGHEHGSRTLPCATQRDHAFR